MAMYEAEAKLKIEDTGIHEELAMFMKRTQERLLREGAEADHAEAHAKMARHRAEETRRVYEATAKLHESMTSEPRVDTGIGAQTITFPHPPGGWQVRQ